MRQLPRHGAARELRLLDRGASDELTRVIAGLGREGVSILLVEQNLRLAEAVADRVYVMVKGRMVYEAPLARFQAERDEVKARFRTL